MKQEENIFEYLIHSQTEIPFHHLRLLYRGLRQIDLHFVTMMV
jgi:hypothetical protein